MLWYVVFYALFGLCIGSFLNVCIHRIPRKESIVSPASHCPNCNTPIRAYDNIPLLSYLWLRGKCRACGNAISLRYPFVELLTSTLFALCASAWQFAPPTIVNSVLAASLVVLMFIDYDHQILPNAITLPGITLGILLSPFQSSIFFRDLLTVSLAELVMLGDPDAFVPWIGSVVGSLVGGGMLLAVGTAYQALRKRQGLGMGDVKMMAMVGAFLGWRLAFLTIFSGSLLGSLAGVFLIVRRGETLQSKLAFGTFLGAGALLSLFFGIPLLQWFTSTP